MKPTHINELFCTLLEREKKQDSFAYRLLEKHSNPERVIDVKNDIKELQGDLEDMDDDILQDLVRIRFKNKEVNFVLNVEYQRRKRKNIAKSLDMQNKRRDATSGFKGNRDFKF